MPSASETRRPLTEGERQILAEVQRHFGAQNDEASVFFSDKDEAVIFASDKSGRNEACVVLTNLAAFVADGTISSSDQLREWLGVPAPATPWWRRLTKRWSGP